MELLKTPFTITTQKKGMFLFSTWTFWIHLFTNRLHLLRVLKSIICEPQFFANWIRFKWTLSVQCVYTSQQRHEMPTLPKYYFFLLLCSYSRLDLHRQTRRRKYRMCSLLTGWSELDCHDSEWPGRDWLTGSKYRIGVIAFPCPV